MDRTPEPELMDDPAQALAYARGDFEQPHNQFIALFRERFPDWAGRGQVLDLGCGPGDICRRFARAFPECRLTGVDGARAMLDIGRADIAAMGLATRIELIEGYLPGAVLPHTHYDAIISNSLLHHLADPQVLWRTIRQYAAPGAPVFVMDLHRPVDADAARALVETYAANEPEVLRMDFHHSLLAAYRVDEIEAQLELADIDWLTIAAIGDRHVTLHGSAP